MVVDLPKKVVLSHHAKVSGRRQRLPARDAKQTRGMLKQCPSARQTGCLS